MQVLALLHVGEGGIDTLRAFEHQALAILREHGGTLISAFEPERAGEDGIPDEIHLLEFPTAEVFAAYRADPRLADLGDLRARAIASTVVYVARRTVRYGD